FACQATSPVLLNYPPDAVEGGVVLASNVLGPAFLSTVGTSGVELQGPSAATGKAARRCKDAIGRVRSKIVKHVVAAATACQKKIDKHSTTFAAIDPSCLAKARGAFPEDVSHLRKACHRISGADVGSCADLPGC